MTKNSCKSFEDVSDLGNSSITSIPPPKPPHRQTNDGRDKENLTHRGMKNKFANTETKPVTNKLVEVAGNTSQHCC